MPAKHTPLKKSEPRKRDAEATALDILDAARALFSEMGYDAVGTRDIARRAGVNVALINRYYGSKAGLFAAAIPPMLSLEALVEGDMSTFGARAAAMLMAKSPTDGCDPVLALLRSATSLDASPMLREALQSNVIAPIASRLPGPDPEERAQLIGSQIAGFLLCRNVLLMGQTGNHDEERLGAALARSLQELATP